MKKTFMIVFVMANMLAIVSCSGKSNNGDSDEDAIYVSIIQLIANPAEYHGKKIRITGVAHLAYEENEIYISKDDWYYSISENALWVCVEVDRSDHELWYYINGERISYEDAQKKYNGKYVEVNGTFGMYEKSEKGRRISYSGYIYDITSYYNREWMNRESYVINDDD